MILDAYFEIFPRIIPVKIETNSAELPHDGTDDFPCKLAEELSLDNRFDVDLMLSEDEPKGKLFVPPLRCGYRLYRPDDNSEWFKAQSLNVNPNTGKRP